VTVESEEGENPFLPVGGRDGIRAADPCSQTRFYRLLSFVECCGIQKTDDKTVAVHLLNSMEVLCRCVRLQLQNYLHLK
jgi:hypothetical protein